MPAAAAQVSAHQFGILERQFALFVELHLHHETQLAQHQCQRFRQAADAVAFGQPKIGIALAHAGIDEALHGITRDSSQEEAW